MRKEIALLAGSLALIFCMMATLDADAQTTIHVPADQPTIQQAIFAASDGDTILVSPGTYFEALLFTGRAITLASTDGAAVTTIDGLGIGTVMTFQNGEATSTVVRGFTITHGFGANAGAISAIAASPTIENNIITANQGCQAPGVLLENSSAIVRHNTISNNTQSCGGTLGGGGIEIDGQGSPQVLNNVITGNHAFVGGGIQIGNAVLGTPIISSNTIQNNISDSDGGGIFSNGNTTFTDNLVTGNQAAGNGGGIEIVPGSLAVLVNNTIAANTASLGPQLYLDGSTGVQLSNNILYDQTGAGAVFCSFSGGTVFPNFDSNDAVSLPANAPGTFNPPYTGSCEDVTGFNGNIQKDPQFVNAANNDYHVSAFSPVVDAGNNAAFNLPVLDLDGNPRIGAGSVSCQGLVDIGAYEFVFVTDGSAALGNTNLFFGTQLIGASASPQIVVLTGTQGCAQIASITTTGDYTQTNDCSALQPATSCTIQVTFVPRTPGILNGSLVINLRSTLPTTPITATLSGQAQNAGSVLPTNLDFGNQPVQTTSTTQVVEVVQSPEGPLVTSSISITGDFAQSNTCTGPFATGGSCFIDVTFTPTHAGLRLGTMTVSTNQGVYTVPLLGNGAAPLPDFTPVSLTFPTEAVGSASAEQTATLTNDGTADLQVAGMSLDGDFATTANDCPPTLAPSASCTFRLTFNPTAQGTRTGTLTLSTNGGAATLNLSGTGTAPIASLAPQVLTFLLPPQGTTSAAQTILLTNISGAPLQITSISAPDYFLAASNCPQQLDISASCSISITVTPLPQQPAPQSGLLSVATSLGEVTAALAVNDGHRTIRVPLDAGSIGAAVAAAQNGDVILVAPGTYFEQVNFQGKAITIASTSGPAATIIDGNGFSTPVFIGQQEGPGSILRGFTITHGQPNGISISFASPTIENNLITNNSGCNSGAGISAFGSSAVVRNNIISNNSSGSGCVNDGGGVFIGGGIANNTDLQLLNNTITGNQANGNGGGIVVEGPATITSNIVQNNSAGSSGGGIAVQSSGATLTSNLVTGNMAMQDGGGIYASNVSSSLLFFNNTITDNATFSSAGGVFVDGAAQFVNNIVIDSTGAGAVACGFLSGQIPSFSFNDVLGIPGQPATVYTMACPDFTGTAGNIQQDPQFVNQSGGDYHLQSSSPAIDAGLEFVGSLSEQDLDGKARVAPGSASCSGAVDIGSYEFGLTGSGTVFQLPPSLDFGSATLGTNLDTQSLAVNVSGCVPLASVKVTGDFQQTNPCNGAIGGTFGSCSIQVTFVPSALGARTGTLTLDFGGVSPPQTIILTGQGVGVTPAALPGSLDFGSVVVQTSSAAQTVTISPQLSSLPFLVNGIWITGNFAQTNDCPLAPASPTGSACSINVVFTPTANGPETGLLTVSTNQGIVTVPLSGSGIPQATLTPATLFFGDQLVNLSSAAQAVTLTNTGSSPVTLGALTISAGFSVDALPCQPTLSPGQSCNYNITFLPTAVGPASGAFTVQTDAGTLTVSLSGNGVAPVASVSPQLLAFAAQPLQTTSSTQTVTLSNTGTALLNISGISATGDFAQSNNCPASLAPGTSCAISVSFTPTTTGTRVGTLVVSSDGGTASVALSGVGAAPDPVFSAGAIAFGDVRVGTTSIQAVTLTNNGNDTFNISGLVVSGATEFTQASDCAATLAPGQSCTIHVSFLPVARGARAATLSVNTTQPVTTPTVSLSGNGIAPVALLTQGLTFAAQVVGTTSSQMATLSNSGDAPLNISTITVTGDFAETSVCPASLAPGTACSITVSFTPSAAGARSGALTVADDDPAVTQQSTALSGAGLDYALSASPASISTHFGHSVQTSITVSALGGSFGNSVALSCSGLPTGASCSFTPASVIPGATSASSTITVNTQLSGGVKTPRGTYTITVVGSSGGLVRSTPITLTVM